MKKKRITKKLSLGKKQISNLKNIQGGIQASYNGGLCTSQLVDTCTWYSELNTACECEPSWYGGCESVEAPCPLTVDLNCAGSVKICPL